MGKEQFYFTCVHSTKVKHFYNEDLFYSALKNIDLNAKKRNLIGNEIEIRIEDIPPKMELYGMLTLSCHVF